MVESKDSNVKQYPYDMTSQNERNQVLNQVFSTKDSTGKLLSDDLMLRKMVERAEEMYEPKQVHSKKDWLDDYNEPRQTLLQYAQGADYIYWSSSNVKTIILKQLGNSLDFETCFQLKAYCEAFFHGFIASIELAEHG